eukprot:206860-Rhodomonas_salina.1
MPFRGTVQSPLAKDFKYLVRIMKLSAAITLLPSRPPSFSIAAAKASGTPAAFSSGRTCA